MLKEEIVFVWLELPVQKASPNSKSYQEKNNLVVTRF